MAALACGVAASLLPAAAVDADTTVVNRIVLRINDRIATLRDYEKRKVELEQALLARQDLPLEDRREALNALGERVYSQMYEELLLLSRADQLNITLSEDDIDEEIQRVRGQMGLSNQQDFERALASTGLTIADLRAQTRKNLLTQTVIGREVYGGMRIDEEILRRYYRDNPDDFMTPERYKLRDVVVLEEKTPDAEARKSLADELRQEVATGRSLDEVAGERSADGTTSSLIDLGWVSADDLAPELRAAVEGLAPGQLSEPTEARGGCHLLELLEREEAELRPFSDVSDQIRVIERQRRAAAEIEKFFTKLEDEAYVILDPPDEAKGFRGLTRSDDATEVPPLLAAPPATEPAAGTESPAASEASSASGEPAVDPSTSG